MSLESVISAISGWLLLDQALSAREIFGCVLMFGAIVLAQLRKSAGRRRDDIIYIVQGMPSGTFLHCVQFEKFLQILLDFSRPHHVE